VTTRKARLRALMLGPTEAQQEIPRIIDQLSENDRFCDSRAGPWREGVERPDGSSELLGVGQGGAQNQRGTQLGPAPRTA
jgi:hypothetical protein